MRCSLLSAQAAIKAYSSITLTGTLADYVAATPVKAFIETHGERHPTDLAGLRGVHLVASQETEEGRDGPKAKSKR